MRKIALIAVVAFAAACGSSSSTPTGYLRVANLAPDILAADFCVAPTGGTYAGPVMASAGSAAGLLYDVGTAGVQAGLKQMSRYFGYAPGTYDIRIIVAAPGATCATPLATITGVTLVDGGYRTIGFVGTGSTGSDAPFAATAFTDQVTVASSNVAIRFSNETLTPTGVATPAFMKGISWNVGLTAASVYTPLFVNMVYPGIAQSGPRDVNGYVNLPTTQLPVGNITLNVCPYPLDPTSGQCAPVTVSAAQIKGGIAATAYMIGGVGITAAGQYKQTALFCGDVMDGAIQQFGNYSSCTAALQ